MKSYTVNSELAAERAKATFNISELTTLIDRGEHGTTTRKQVEKFFTEDPNIPNPFTYLGLSSDDYYDKLIKTTKYVHKKIEKQELPGQLPGAPSFKFGSYIKYLSSPSENPLTIHEGLFIPSVLYQANKEQLERWQPMIETGVMLGSYAQTELGHGSNIQQLETTATYDENTEEFILHTPTITSMKCWPGGLARVANFAIVMAQLYIKGKCHGLHMFMVQLRDLKDHKHLLGVITGELGPQMGYVGADNGFLKLNKVRIPRDNMLMKNAQVLKDGTYIKSKLKRSTYGTMIFGRMLVVTAVFVELGQASTIAVRYNAVRRQGGSDKSGLETKLLDYQTQQYKLFPAVAFAYAFCFAQHRLSDTFFAVQLTSDEDIRHELHIIACTLKAFGTTAGYKAAENCRNACGGLGYLQASHLPTITGNFLAASTFEGDNTVMELQSARYLLKSVKKLQNGETIAESVQYLKGKRDTGDRTCMSEFLHIFETATAGMIFDVSKRMSHSESMGKNSDTIFQENAVKLTKCAHFHAHVYVLNTLHNFFLKTKLSIPLREVLEKLFEFLAVYWIQTNSGDIILFGKFPINKIAEYQERIPSLLQSLRPNIVALVDAFDYCDETLQSVIGSYDGRVYERFDEYLTNLPSNKKQLMSAKPRL